MNLTISASTNRITLRRTNNCTESPNLSVGHDAAGNMTSEPGRTYQYDAENRIKSVNNGSIATYQYDADGRRSVKNSASGTRIYFYDIEGRSIAESGPTQGGWLSGRAYFQNRHVFENTGAQFLWRHTDHLGTAVVRTDSNGGKICDSRFYPYGEEFTPDCAGDPYKFTGKERDSETGLDYFGARYYGNHYGRFTSVDPALESGKLINPQSWNRFVYTLNNPLKFVDHHGRSPTAVTAAVGGAIGASFGFTGSVVAQLIGNGWDLSGVNFKDAGAAAAGGAISGALAGATLGLSMVAQTGTTGVIVVASGSNMIGGAITRSLDSDPSTSATDVNELVIDGVFGAAGGVAGAKAGEALRSPLPRIEKGIETSLPKARQGSFVASQNVRQLRSEAQRVQRRSEIVDVIVGAKGANLIVPAARAHRTTKEEED